MVNLKIGPKLALMTEFQASAALDPGFRIFCGQVQSKLSIQLTRENQESYWSIKGNLFLAYFKKCIELLQFGIIGGQNKNMINKNAVNLSVT